MTPAGTEESKWCVSSGPLRCSSQIIGHAGARDNNRFCGEHLALRRRAGSTPLSDTRYSPRGVCHERPSVTDGFVEPRLLLESGRRTGQTVKNDPVRPISALGSTLCTCRHRKLVCSSPPGGGG